MIEDHVAHGIQSFTDLVRASIFHNLHKDRENGNIHFAQAARNDISRQWAEMSNIATKYGFLSRGKLKEQITADELLKKCNAYLDITVENTQVMCLVLEKELGYHHFKVYPNHHIHLYEGLDNAERICELAVSRHAGLTGVEHRKVNLENYYMNIVEGN